MLIKLPQMHYNLERGNEDPLSADLHTYMENPEVFKIENGYIEILQGQFSY
jgi:hypothetical protein